MAGQRADKRRKAPAYGRPSASPQPLLLPTCSCCRPWDMSSWEGIMNQYAKAECQVCKAYFEIQATDDQALIIFQAHGILTSGAHDFVGEVIIFTKPDKPGKRRAA